MQATTSDARLLPGITMIEELHNLRQKVHEQQVLLTMIDNVAQREAEARAREAAEQEAAEQERDQRELGEAIAHFERLARRDYAHDTYLRRIYGQPRPGARRVWA